ncbi:MAG: hypothetical protein IJJ41_08090 [Clostridia bacterium]|nr:hypothetical protein [Clostridia bacterium]
MPISALRQGIKIINAAYLPLGDINTFKGVDIDYSVAVWNGGDIDIAPEYLYEHGVNSEEVVA